MKIIREKIKRIFNVIRYYQLAFHIKRLIKENCGCAKRKRWILKIYKKVKSGILARVSFFLIPGDR